MSSRALDAAGIHDGPLRAAYEQCRRLHAAHGRTYYLATLLLPPAKRPYVHALYGFARHADEFVDGAGARSDALLGWAEGAVRDLRRGASADPVVLALADTLRRWSIPYEHVEAFLDSMRMDLHIRAYPTYADLGRYMYGSAAVIGLALVPILEPLPGREQDAAACASALGEAFQLTNFLRDVAEDLDRGRVYLPVEDLARFGLTRADLERRVATPRVRALVAFEAARTRARYAEARRGIALLHPSSRACVRTASTLYGGILDRLERVGYDVFAGRVAVPLPRRLAVAAPAWAHAVAARAAYPRAIRRPHQTHQASVCSTSENPNSTSSTGAHATRAPSTAASS